MRHLVSEVSTKSIQNFSPQNPKGKVVVLDCGVKFNILRNFLTRKLEIVLVPYNSDYEKIMSYNPDGMDRLTVILGKGTEYDYRILNDLQFREEELQRFLELSKKTARG